MADGAVMLDYRYAIVRVVPRAERDECINVGVIVFVPASGYLAARIATDLDLVRALAPQTDLVALRTSLTAVELICAGSRVGGPASAGSASFRFGHLTAPRSTMVRTSGTHGGIAADPDDALNELYAKYVAR
ncbi:MAG: DUF3037 domain-containing protein [Cumulibacter sp.]